MQFLIVKGLKINSRLKEYCSEFWQRFEVLYRSNWKRLQNVSKYSREEVRNKFLESLKTSILTFYDFKNKRKLF